MSLDHQDRVGRKDPEALLRHAQAAERARHRGQLKIFLGYASGVGKSFKLFDEGRRRHERGEDIVIAAMQPHNDRDVLEAARGLDVIATRTIDGVPVLDVPALLARRPAACLVDGLAYDNPPQSRHPKRYQDVEALLDCGISVLTSINLEYIEEQQDFARGLTGKPRAATVPQAFVTAADEIVVVDAPPDVGAAASDAARGAGDLAQRLSRLRERALLLAADVVDHQLETYLALHGIQSSWGTQERILVAMTPRANAAAMLASGRRNADRFHGELFAVYVNQPHLTDEDRMALERNVMLARAQDALVEILYGRDPVSTILDYARSHGVTQIFVGHNLRRNWRARLAGSPLDQLIRGADGIDVRVFPH
jgi:two-component system, OmpR family, sensor histidine kinase KdpD